MKLKKFIPVTALFALCVDSKAEPVEYMTGFLEGLTPNGQALDLSYLQKGLSVPPGFYYLSVKINGNLLFSKNLELREHNGDLQPVFKVSDLLLFPISDKEKVRLSLMTQDDEVFPLSTVFEGASAKYDIATLMLDVSVPQVYLSRSRSDYDVAPKELWDYGANGAIINYNITANRNEGKGSNDYENNSLLGSFNGQLNLGAWRFYTSGSFYRDHNKYDGRTSTSSGIDFGSVYARRDLPALNSTVELGQLYTDGTLFNSFSMLGMRMYTNQSMIPESDRYYVPVVNGTANTDAQIIVRIKNLNEDGKGEIIHTENVVAGPFVIDNLPNSIGNVDLEVEIREANGVVRKFIVPNSSVPNMLKAGQVRYDMSMGQYYRENMSSDQKKLPFLMVTGDYGLPFDMTLYGGMIFSDGYISGALGTAFSLGDFGALALDSVYSKVNEDVDRGLLDSDGVALRVRYEKSMFSTGTAINIVNYRYTSRNFKDFSEVAEARILQDGEKPYNYGTLRSRWSFSVSQSLGDYGSLSASYSMDDYRDDATDYKNFSVNYSNSFYGIGYNLSLYRDYQKYGNQDWKSSNNAMFSFYIPFSVFLSDTSYSNWGDTSLNYYGTMTDYGDEKDYTHQVSLSGGFSDLNLNWSLNQNIAAGDNRNTSLSLGYHHSQFNADMAITNTKRSNSYRAGINGGLVIHSGGITAMNQSYDSIAIVKVGDLSGVKVKNAFDVETDWAGYGVLTNLNNYTKNEIGIDPSTLPNGAALDLNAQKVVYPTQGSIIKVEFPVTVGTHALFNLSIKGKPVALGTQASLLDENGVERQAALVGLNGRTYLSGIPFKGKVKVVAKDDDSGNNKEYYFNYSLPQDTNEDDIPQLNLNVD